MSNKEFNIKSSTIEKGLELAKDFLGRLINPAAEEVGLLISDNIKYFRFKNQVRILLKAKDYVEKKNIKIKEIPIKILVPLLENASLEDNDTLQNKWANLLVNMIDSEKNLQNQIFPYILSQISIEEYEGLKEILDREQQHRLEKTKLEELKKDDKFSLQKETREQQKRVNEIEQSGFWVSLEEYEISNLLRLGLIRQLPPKIYIEEFQTGGHFDEGEKWHQIEAEYDPDDFGHRLTELGEKFIEICELKIEKV